jgi:hypothetical protein
MIANTGNKVLKMVEMGETLPPPLTPPHVVRMRAGRDGEGDPLRQQTSAQVSGSLTVAATTSPPPLWGRDRVGGML